MNSSILIRILVICVSLAPSAFLHSESSVRVAHTTTEESHTKDSRSKRDSESDGLWHNATRTPVRAAVTSIILTSGATPLLSVCAFLSKLGAIGCIMGGAVSVESKRPDLVALSAAGAFTCGVASAAFTAGAALTFLVGIGAGIKCLVLCTQ